MPVSSPRVFQNLSPYARGSLFYLGYWGVGGVYLGFVNVFFAQIGLDLTQIGFLSALVPLLVLTLAPLVAGWADLRAARVRLVAFGLAGLGLSMIALFFTRGFTPVLIVYAVFAAFTSVVPPVADGLIVRMAVKHKLEFGRMRLWGSLSFAITSALSGWLWGRIGYAPMFLISGALFLLLAPVALSLEETTSVPVRAKFSAGNILRDSGTLTVLLLSLVVGLALGLSTPFLGVNIERLGGSALQIGLLFAVIAIAEVPVMRLEARLARVVGDAGVLAIACACFTSVYAAFALIPDPNWLIVFSLLEGVGFALFFVATVRIVDDRAEAGRSSTLQSIRGALTFGIAPLLASPSGGAIFAAIGPGVFAITATLMLVAVGIALARRNTLRSNLE
jgi:MFS transporter, PPP family, 3-phenylpropionic acid transporter